MIKVVKEQDTENFQEIAKSLKDGGIVVFPTDTVYGVGVSMASPKGLEKLYSITKRPKGKPVILLIDDVSWVEKLTSDIPKNARKLISAFWPGALTIIFNASKKVPPEITADGKIGLRIPQNLTAIRLIKELGMPIATKSANFSEQQTPSQFLDVDFELLNLCDWAIDGKISLKIASTVLDISGKKIKIVREGAVTRKKIESFLKSSE